VLGAQPVLLLQPGPLVLRQERLQGQGRQPPGRPGPWQWAGWCKRPG